MSEEKAEYMNSPVDELKMCASCSDTGTTEGFNRWTLEPCVVFCDCPKGEAKKEQRRQELQSKNTRAESPDSVETCDYCNARLNAAGECDNDECDIFEYKPTPPVAGGDLENRIIALMNIIKERRIDPVLGDVEDDIYNTMKYCLAALQHQDCVVISRECAKTCLEGLETLHYGPRVVADPKNSVVWKRMQELKQSLERKNG